MHYKSHSDHWHCNYQQKCELLQGGCEDSTGSHCAGNEDFFEWASGEKIIRGLLAVWAFPVCAQ